MFYGVNRHDFNRYTGRALTREDMREDLLELKRWNFNAVRTSHYPNDAVELVIQLIPHHNAHRLNLHI